MKKKTDQRKINAAAKKIRLLVLDVDGVLTDGSIFLDNDGNELKAFNVRDGHGIRMLSESGITVAIITGRNSRVVERRAAELGIVNLYQGCHIKTEAYEQLLKKFELAESEVAYVGDDVVDIPILKRVGLPVVVADAVDEARKHALLVTKNCGGRGAVREVTDLLLKAAGRWNELMNEHNKA
jgi:3-deoxy-D-manno-octulosonate 8-phosphate phosphatase (KDO 8-P phosphatase)